MKTSLPLGTELLISAYLAKIDDFNNQFQEKVIEKLTRERVSALLFDFDIENALNKQLVALCVQRGVFADESQVVFTLMTYGKELMEFQTRHSDQFKASVEKAEDNFRPDPRSARYMYYNMLHVLRMYINLSWFILSVTNSQF